MGFFDSLACAFGGCASGSDLHISNVSNILKAKMNVSCASTAVASQTMTCGFQGSHCSHLNMNCANTASFSANCNMQQLLKAASDTLLKTESLDSLRQGLHLPGDASEEDIRNEIVSQVSEACGSDEAVQQSVNAGILCNYSDYIVADVFNTMNLQSSCTTAHVLGIASQSQALSKSTQKIIFIVAIVLVLTYIIILGVLVIKVRASGRTVGA